MECICLLSAGRIQCVQCAQHDQLSGERCSGDSLDQSPGRTLNVVSVGEINDSYINGQSFVLRHKNEPFKNLFTDEAFITRNRVENMEKSLKKDVTREAHQDAGSNILAHDEESLQHVHVAIRFFICS